MKKNFKIFISSIIIIFSLITVSNSIEPTSGAYVTDKAAVPAARAYIDAFKPVQLLDYFLCISKNQNTGCSNFLIDFKAPSREATRRRALPAVV